MLCVSYKTANMASKTSCLLVCCYLYVVNGFGPMTYNMNNLHSSSECGQSNPLQEDQLMQAISKIHQELGPPGCNPPQNRSCQEVLYCFPSAPSGYNEIHVPNGSLVQVYCDMEGTNCGGQGGWMRVAYYANTSQPGATCPQGLTQNSPITSELILCGQTGIGCRSTFFSTFGFSYSRVCGRL